MVALTCRHCTNSRRDGFTAFLLMSQRRSDKRRKQRMRLQRLRLKLWMKLATQEPRMVRSFHNLHIILGRSPSRDFQSRRNQRLLMLAVEFIAMPMPFADVQLPIGFLRADERRGGNECRS